MNSRALLRLAYLLIASLFVLASCGDDDESASSTTTTTTSQTTTSATAADDAATQAEAVEVEGPAAVDDRSTEEIAIGRLDVSMAQLGITEFEETANCVMDRLESEGIELTGEGTAELIALTRCDVSVVSEWLPDTNENLADDDWACTVESIGDWINELSIPDAEAFFAASSPSTEFVEVTAGRCDASAEEIAAALS